MFPPFYSGSQLGRCTDLRAEPGLVECGTRKHSLLPSPAAPEIGAGRGDLNLSPKSYSGAQRGHSTQLAFLSASDRGSRWARELAQVTAQVTGLIPIAEQSGGSSSHQTVKLVSFLIFGNKKRHCSGKPSSKTAIIKKKSISFFFSFSCLTPASACKEQFGIEWRKSYRVGRCEK